MPDSTQIQKRQDMDVVKSIKRYSIKYGIIWFSLIRFTKTIWCFNMMKVGRYGTTYCTYYQSVVYTYGVPAILERPIDCIKLLLLLLMNTLHNHTLLINYNIHVYMIIYTIIIKSVPSYADSALVKF